MPNTQGELIILVHISLLLWYQKVQAPCHVQISLDRGILIFLLQVICLCMQHIKRLKWNANYLCFCIKIGLLFQIFQVASRHVFVGVNLSNLQVILIMLYIRM